jgi:glycosyltransferase involved in cell wall biosynthesis
MQRMIYLGVQPTPYTQYFLQYLKRSKEIGVRVFYSTGIISDLPWKSNMIDREDRVFKKRLGIDWSIIKMAFTDKNSMFYIVGYNDPTKFLVLLIRGLFKYPYCYFTDSIKTEKNKYYPLKVVTLPILFKNARAILTTGDFGVKRLQTSNYCSKHTPLVNLPFFVPFPDINKKADVNHPVKFLCSGRLVERKGFDLVIEAFNICKRKYNANFSLYIAGTGTKQQELKQLVDKYGLNNEITFLGWLEPDEMRAWMLKANVFIHFVPIHDPFPVAVLEAMATGLPIIGSNKAGSVVERVKHGENGFVIDSTDIDGLAGAIMEFIKDPSLVKKMSVASRKTAEEWPVERAGEIIKTLF